MTTATLPELTGPADLVARAIPIRERLAAEVRKLGRQAAERATAAGHPDQAEIATEVVAGVLAHDSAGYWLDVANWQAGALIRDEMPCVLKRRAAQAK